MPLRTLANRAEVSAEAEFLLEAACPNPEAMVGDRLRELAHRVGDWEWVREAAMGQGVAPYVHQNLSAAGAEGVPSALRAYLEEQFYATAGLNGLLAQRLGDLSRRFEAGAIPMFAFKGPTLALTAYGSLARRHAGDLDLFIRPEDRPRAVLLLEAAGYQALAGAEPLEQHFRSADGRVTVDLHWGLACTHARSLVPTPDWWARRETVLVAGNPVPCPAAAELLLLLCVNAARSRVRLFLSNACDIAAQVRAHPDLDWERALAVARAQQCERLLLAGLGVTARLWPLDLPREIRTRISASFRTRTLSALLEQRVRSFRGGYDPLRQAWFLLLCAESRMEAAEALRPLLTPNAEDFRAVRLPRPLAPLYYLARPLRLMRTYGLSLRPDRRRGLPKAPELDD